MSDLAQRIDAVEARLAALAAARPRPGALTDPDPGAEERWEAAQVWAHLGEFGAFWLDEIDAVLGSSDPAPPFGRVKSNPARIAAIETGRHEPATTHLDAVRGALARLRALHDTLDGSAWARTATHQTLGVLTLEQIVEEFLIGHYEQHADQLERLG